MRADHNRSFTKFLCLLLTIFLLSLPALSQACFTADDMDAATRTALQSAGTRYFDMLTRGDSAAIKQNSIPSLAANFAGLEGTIKENQTNLAGGKAIPRPPFMLKAEGMAPLPKAEFLCGVFGPNGQTTNSAEFIIPNLPPGAYGVVTLDAQTQKSPYTVSFVLQQQGTDWKIGSLFILAAQIAGHDSNWFVAQARSFKAKGQNHNAWLYFVQGRQMAVPVPFMYTQLTDKLYDEAQSVKPADFPVDGKTTDLAAAGGKTYKLTSIFPLPVGQDFDLVVMYQAADVSNTGQTFQENMAVMRALVTKYPEVRDAFGGIVARAVEPSGKDYGSLLPMKDIK
jgi:hypothetical protein